MHLVRISVIIAAFSSLTGCIGLYEAKHPEHHLEYTKVENISIAVEGGFITQKNDPKNLNKFLRQAQVNLQKAGFITNAEKPDYKIDLAFTNVKDNWNDWWLTLAIDLPTLLFCSRVDMKMTGNATLYDCRNNKMIWHKEEQFSHDYVMFSPFWCYGHIANPKLYRPYYRRQITPALTNILLADATAFLKEYHAKQESGAPSL